VKIISLYQNLEEHCGVATQRTESWIITNINLSETDWSASCISFDWLSFCGLASAFKLLPRKDTESSKRLSAPFASTCWKPSYGLVGRHSLVIFICNCNFDCNCNHTKTLINSPVECNHRFLPCVWWYECMYVCVHICICMCVYTYKYTYRSFATTVSQIKISDFWEKRLKVLKFYTFLRVQRRHNCSSAASFANCFMTLCLLIVHLPKFLSILVNKKCQILSCDTLVANERYVCPSLRPVYV
jgi:hypothetical protein